MEIKIGNTGTQAGYFQNIGFLGNRSVERGIKIGVGAAGAAIATYMLSFPITTVLAIGVAAAFILDRLLGNSSTDQGVRPKDFTLGESVKLSLMAGKFDKTFDGLKTHEARQKYIDNCREFIATKLDERALEAIVDLASYLEVFLTGYIDSINSGYQERLDLTALQNSLNILHDSLNIGNADGARIAVENALLKIETCFKSQ